MTLWDSEWPLSGRLRFFWRRKIPFFTMTLSSFKLTDKVQNNKIYIRCITQLCFTQTKFKVSMQMTIRESKRADWLSHCGLADAPGNRSLHKLLLYYRAHTKGIHQQHKSFFHVNILVHLCDISNLNYQQVKPRNFQCGMLMNGKLSRPENRIFNAV